MADESHVRRPFGIYAIIALQILNMLALLTDLVRVQIGFRPPPLPNSDNPLLLSVVNIAFAILLVVIIIGLWRYQYWAWFGTMVLTGIALIVGIWQYLNGGTPYATLLVNALIVFYLNQRDLRRIFEDHQQLQVTP